MLLDTSGLLNLLSPREAHHAEAVRLYRQNQPSISHNLILAELIAVANARGVDRRMVLDAVDDLIAASAATIIWVDRTLNDRAMALLRSRSDKTYSLADAVSFVLMREHSMTVALTNDRHFEQEGFRRLLV
jgi:uncharacterized protein